LAVEFRIIFMASAVGGVVVGHAIIAVDRLMG
jgi:hypothetical protein